MIYTNQKGMFLGASIINNYCMVMNWIFYNSYDKNMIYTNQKIT